MSSPRTFTVSASDIARCPIHSMSPEHYRDDGSCLCEERVIDRATVRVSAAVDGTKRRKARAEESRPRTSTSFELKVDPRVMAAAKKAMRPGQRLVIVSAEEVRLVNDDA